MVVLFGDRGKGLPPRRRGLEDILSDFRGAGYLWSEPYGR
jgi:hypothetical protein